MLNLKLSQVYRQLCAGAALYDRQQSAKSSHSLRASSCLEAGTAPIQH
ncbi:hypothetical protein FBY12_1257 [Pseudomonas sp. SJZ131]|nr:hypothetical protein FBY12_1257 [Pseudomonas sp. SJZ131]